MKLISAMLDLLYPPKCVLCRRVLDNPRSGVCPKCLQNLPEAEIHAPNVPMCEQTVAALSYEGAVRDSLLRFKFGGLACYADCYGKWLAAVIRDRLDGKFDLITYVPVSAARRRKRGYDQAFLLCRKTAENLHLRPVRTLRKIRNNPPQSGQENAAARKANVSGVYRAVHPETFTGKRVLLIDDIITTGATVQECCRVLLSAGAESVFCAALATPNNDHGKKDETS